MQRPFFSLREQAGIDQSAQSAIGRELRRRYEPPQTLPDRLADLLQRLAEREDSNEHP